MSEIMEKRKANAAAKIEAIVNLIHDELAVYPGDNELSFIHRLLDIIDGEDS